MKKWRARRAESAARQQGFSLIELLVAMTITLLLAGAVAGVAQPARAAFERVPAELELHQRGRAAIDALSQALRASVPLWRESGTFNELSVVVPVPAAAQGLLSIDQPDAGAPMTFAVEQCPNIKDVCGFIPDAMALIIDGGGRHDVFSIASVDAGTRSITPEGTLQQSYPTGSGVFEVAQFTFRLDEQSDGSYTLIRETAAGALQPIVDGVSELVFNVTGREIEAGVFHPERIDVFVIVEALTESLRTVMSGRVFRTSIKLRNAS